MTKNLVEILTSLNQAKTIDIISTNGDKIIGQPANIILAASNISARVRFAQSVNASYKTNKTIEKILFTFGNNLIHTPIYDNNEYSCLIIDETMAFELRYNNNTVSDSSFCLCNITTVSESFFQIWSLNTNDSKIRCLKQLLKEIDSMQLRKGEFSFRGQANCEWPLIPPLLRTFTKNEPNQEGTYFKPLFLRKHLPFLFTLDPIGYLANCQHYGVKTRLLDFTRDILIGLFFACHDSANEYSSKDGKLSIIENKQFPILEPSKLENSIFFEQISDDNINTFKSRLFNTFPMMYEPMVKNPRMRFQDGLLVLFPFENDTQKYLSLEDHIKKWNKGVEEDDKKYWIGHKLVDCRFKKYILNQLQDEFAINEDSVFVNKDDSFYRDILLN